MPVLSEKWIDAKVVRWFKRVCHDGVCIKLAMVGAHGTSGWPDRLFIARGRAAFMELKAPGKKPTPLQEARMAELRAAGAVVSWFDDDEAAINWLGKVLEIP